MTEPLIDISNMEISFANGFVKAVRGVSFQLGREKLGIVGESGSGKSTVGRAIMRLLPPTAKVTADRMNFHQTDLLAASEKRMMEIRGKQIGLILQDPKYSLNPVMRIGEQIAEAYRLHYPNAGGGEDPRSKAGLPPLSARGLGRHGPEDHDRHDADRRT
jgi:peptide/nickel transport system ATP-binding protein